MEQTARVEEAVGHEDSTIIDEESRASDPAYIIRDMCEVEFIELGFVMKLAAIWEDIQELLHWTATGELASLTADAVAGGCPDLEYDDLVAYERDSGVLYGRILGSPDAPETYRVEFGHGNLATIPASDLRLVDRATWPD